MTPKRKRASKAKVPRSTGDEQSSEAQKLEIAWRMAKTPPADPPLTAAQACMGLDRLDAWIRWARLRVDESDPPPTIMQAIARTNAVLSNLRTDDHAQAKVDRRNAVIHDVLIAAEAVNGPDDLRLQCAIGVAERTSPDLTQRLLESKTKTIEAMNDYRDGRRQKAVLNLGNILGDARPNTPEQRSKAWKLFNAWRDNRRERIQTT